MPPWEIVLANFKRHKRSFVQQRFEGSTAKIMEGFFWGGGAGNVPDMKVPV